MTDKELFRRGLEMVYKFEEFIFMWGSMPEPGWGNLGDMSEMHEQMVGELWLEGVGRWP